MGNLNINVRFPCDEREEVIVDLLDEANLVNLSCGYRLQTPCRTTTRAQWTWSQKRGTTEYYLQPDYILGHAKETGIFKGMRSHFPQFLQLDHLAIVTVVRAGGEGQMNQCRCKQQKCLLSLLLGPKDMNTMVRHIGSRVGQTKAKEEARERLDEQKNMAADSQAGVPFAEQPHLVGHCAEDEARDWCRHEGG